MILHAPIGLHAADVASDDQPKASVQHNGKALVVDISMTVQVPIAVAWEVLTDFDHMSTFLPNLNLSESQLQSANTYLVKQRGQSRYGPFSFDFDSVRLVELHPFSRIDAHNVAGNIRKMHSTSTLTPAGTGVDVRYHAEAEIDFWLPPGVGPAALRHDAEERFAAFAAEMKRRRANKP